MSVWGSIGGDDILAASEEAETFGGWVHDVEIDVAVSCNEDRYRIALLLEDRPTEADAYLDRANLLKLRDKINRALEPE